MWRFATGTVVRNGSVGQHDRRGGLLTVIFGQVGSWLSRTVGVLQLPSGRMVRGRGLRDGLPAGPLPEFGLYQAGSADAVAIAVGALA